MNSANHSITIRPGAKRAREFAVVTVVATLVEAGIWQVRGEITGFGIIVGLIFAGGWFRAWAPSARIDQQAATVRIFDWIRLPKLRSLAEFSRVTIRAEPGRPQYRVTLTGDRESTCPIAKVPDYEHARSIARTAALAAAFPIDDSAFGQSVVRVPGPAIAGTDTEDNDEFVAETLRDMHGDTCHVRLDFPRSKAILKIIGPALALGQLIALTVWMPPFQKLLPWHVLLFPRWV